MVYPIETAEGGGLRHAIVSIMGLQDEVWRNTFKETCIDIHVCDFLPLTDVIDNGKTIRVVNPDADAEDPKSAEGILHTAWHPMSGTLGKLVEVSDARTTEVNFEFTDQ